MRSLRAPHNAGSNPGLAADLVEAEDERITRQLIEAATRGLPKGWAWQVIPNDDSDTVDLYLVNTRNGRRAHVKSCYLEDPNAPQ